MNNYWKSTFDDGFLGLVDIGVNERNTIPALLKSPPNWLYK